MKKSDPRIPITILTGFLGAGKTTLLQRILTEKHGKKIAVIENEFANLDIDSNLVKSKSDVLVELFNGCICCSIQGELLQALAKIAGREDRVDQIVIETTGVANPASLVESFLVDHTLRAVFRLDSVITVVDSKHFPLHFQESQDFRDQISYADLLILNKSDLIESNEMVAVEARVREFNQAAEIVFSKNCDIEVDRVFERWEYESTSVRPERMGKGQKTDLPSIVSSLSLEIIGPIDETKFMKWFESFVMTRHDSLYRTKGILFFSDMPKHVVIQGVHAIFSAAYSDIDLLEKEVSRMVFIGKDLPKDQIMAGVKQSLPEFRGSSLSSLSFTPVASSNLSKTDFSIPAPSFNNDQRVRIV